MSKSKQQQLDDIRQQIIDKKVTPELAETATQLVFGEGPADAKMVLIGEAPGKNEDLQGQPFVGAAGKFLNEMLEMIGMNREEVYITNIVKYRPPNNRDPMPEEKAAFMPYLQKQLEVIQPVLVITLGRHSLNCFFPDMQIGQVHGQPKRTQIVMSNGLINASRPGSTGVSAVQDAGEQQTELYREYGEGAAEPATQQRATSTNTSCSFAVDRTRATWTFLPLFHPAAALYNGSMRQTLIDDFAKIPVILTKLQETKAK